MLPSVAACRERNLQRVRRARCTSADSLHNSHLVSACFVHFHRNSLCRYSQGRGEEGRRLIIEDAYCTRAIYCNGHAWRGCSIDSVSFVCFANFGVQYCEPRLTANTPNGRRNLPSKLASHRMYGKILATVHAGYKIRTGFGPIRSPQEQSHEMSQFRRRKSASTDSPLEW